MNHDHYSDELLRGILSSVKTIALVGASNNPERASHHVMQYLIDSGYELYPINPGLAGKEIHGRPVFASLADVPVAIDMVDVFRNSDAAGAVVDEALALSPLPKVIWMQLGVRNDEAAARAEARGITVVMNRCPAIERPRLI
jgi:predicted CoA-binding protein